jgi:D-beta-D-heptose 7-phosphate kinase/D-beta-D-heptose 1-phosphate adenosyltransferase
MERRMSVQTVLEKLINSTKRILVVGDVMLDEYYFGSAERISPEAPVPVFNYKGQNAVLGGAANVAANIAANSKSVYLMAAIGDDANGDRMLNLLTEKGINTSLIIRDQNRKTTVKTRLLAQNNQQLIRIDSEDRQDISQEIETKFMDNLIQRIKEFDIILLSDYLKGLLTPGFTQEIIKAANKNGIKVIADIKDKRVEKYRGAYLLKPNKKELEELTGCLLKTDSDIINALQILKSRTEAECCLVTLGAKGMVFLDRNNRIQYEDALAKQVYDVTGAGDTVLAYLGICYAHGMPDKDCLKISNIAAGIKVGKVGTSTVGLGEIGEYLESQSKEEQKDEAILSVEQLDILNKARKGKTVVFTNGCFDILHVGHIRYLKKAKSLGDILVIGLNTDKSVKRLKGEKRPIVSENERAELLAALSFVDYVVKFDQDTPYELIKRIKPDILVKGGDYLPEQVVGKDIVEGYGGRLEIIEMVDGAATSNIILKILDVYK